MSLLPPVFIVGHIRSGTTILHQMVMRCLPNAIDIDDDDPFEGRLFWQQFGLTMGSLKTGTFCHCADASDTSAEIITAVQNYCHNRCQNRYHIVNKNPHLANKINFVSSVLPDAKFIHIIREPYATVASVKLRFDKVYSGRNYWGIPFRHYWPDDPLPCWHTAPACGDRSPRELTSLVKRLSWRPDHTNQPIQTYLRRLVRPPQLLNHAFWPMDSASFHQQYPDNTRYYPGEGFARIPEAWLTINNYIQDQLAKLPAQNVMVVNYDTFCAETRKTVHDIVQFIGVTDSQLNLVDPSIDVNRKNKWQKDLTENEKTEVSKVLSNGKKAYDNLSLLYEVR